MPCFDVENVKSFSGESKIYSLIHASICKFAAKNEQPVVLLVQLLLITRCKNVVLPILFIVVNNVGSTTLLHPYAYYNAGSF